MLSLLAIASALGATLTVDDDGVADYITIQAAIDAAQPGDVIQVAAGEYEEMTSPRSAYAFGLHLHGDIEIHGAGPDVTIVRVGATTQGRTGCLGVTDGVTNAVVTGLTCIHESPGTESGTHAYAAFSEGSTWYEDASGTVEIRNVVFQLPNNRARSIHYNNNAGLSVSYENVVVDFGTAATPGSFSYSNVNNNTLYMRNSIVFNTNAIRHYNGSFWNMQYSMFTPASAPAGTGNLSANPLFSGVPESPYSLSSGSPAIDAGDPDPSYNDLDGSRNDMGVYGGPASAPAPLQCPASHNVINLPSGGTACIHPNATVADVVALGDGCRIDDGAFIASRAAIGAGVHVQDGVIIGRRATLGSNSTVQSGAVLSRAVQVGNGANIGPNAALGYASQVGNQTTVGANSVLGALASVGANADIGTAGMVVLARDAHIGDGADVAGIGIIGPEVTIGTDFLATGGFRIRKQATLQDTVTLHDGVRIGRDATVQNNSQVAASVTIGANACASGSVTASIVRGQSCL